MKGYAMAQTATPRLTRLVLASWGLLLFVIWAVTGRLARRRVPVILQLTAVECGAACLTMVLNYYGCKTALSECRGRLGVGRDGVTARAIADTARSYGLRVRAYSVEPDDFQRLQLPVITHWEFKHFVVIERWSRGKAQVVDPAVGRRQLAAAEFDAAFTGVVLTLEPGDQFQRQRASAAAPWRRYISAMLRGPGIPGVLVQVTGASLLLLALGAAAPVFTKVLVDEVLPLRITNMMPVLGIGMVVLVLVQAVSSYLRAILLLYLEARLDSQLMLGFFEHVLALPFRFFQQRPSGDLIMRLGSNTIIRETLTGQTLSALLDGALVVVYLAVLVALEPVFGLIVFGVGALQVVLLVVTTRRVHSLMQRELLAQAEGQSYLVEALTGIGTLKASGAEDRAFEHWSSLFFRHLNISLQRGHLSAVVQTGLATLRTFSPLLLLWVGALYVLNGAMSLGTMLALNALAVSFLTPLASLVSSGQALQLVAAHLDRIADVVEAEPEQDLTSARSAPALAGRVELQGVSFRYSPEAPLVLRDISFTIEPGQKVALVGRSGSGKSTLARLLLGLYTPTEGQVLYDGLPQQSFNYRTLRRQFGVVLQESFLFSGSIRQNIAFNDPSLSLEQVMAAARLAAIHDEVMQMPMGYETLVAEGGSALSGGQRQRLSLARAVAHRPALLLLDEATSHLDVVTESLIDQNLSALSCTRIFIAHRLSTIRNADLILVLDHGAVVERGTHAELLARGDHYAQLVHSQLEGETGKAPGPAHGGPEFSLRV